MSAPEMLAHCLVGLRDFGKEREQRSRWIDKFEAEGASACTTHPHSFFGTMTPDERAVLIYKHLDHHLRQFGF